jgi:ornithine cyclodeaminase/alanine dehydrogenase-like protein (mu-crystallin family)
MQIRMLNRADVHALLPMPRCVELMRDAMAMVADGRTVQPIRQVLRQPDDRGLLSMMPGFTSTPPWLGIKVVSVFPGNFGTAFGSHQGLVLLFDPENGAPAAIVDGGEITAVRTAAATAVATDVLARPDASSLGLFGYGEQAVSHLQALKEVRSFSNILVWGRDPAKAAAFAARQAAELGMPISATSDPAEAGACDVVTTVTSSPGPVFLARWLRPGQHLNAVGSSVPGTYEVDEQTVAATRFYVDFRDSALQLAGEFRRARELGLVDNDHIVGSIGQVLCGQVAGRTDPGQITLFKSLGMICEDLVAADEVLRAAEREGRGTLVKW